MTEKVSKNVVEILKEIEEMPLEKRLELVSGLLKNKKLHIAEQLLSRTYNELVIYNATGKIMSEGCRKTVQP